MAGQLEETSRPLADERVRAWQEELSDRVEGYRRRRSRLQGEPEMSGTLDFDASDVPSETPRRKVIDFPIGNLSAPEDDGQEIVDPADQLSIDPQDDNSPSALGEVFMDNPAAANPVEIVLESSPPEPADRSSALGGSNLTVAPLGKRFVAGILDILVLLLAAGLFALIFWRAGGHISHRPLDLAVVAFIIGFFILIYFGSFTAFTSSTPGLMQMGLEVRSLDGRAPAMRDSFWRAIGYLVSMAALMLGFIWALVDGDGLTWHDRMSETFIRVAETTAVQPEKAAV